jgi:ABC-2 type transport system permease protein
MGEGSMDDMANLIINQSNALSYVMFFTLPASIALGTDNILLSIGCMLIFIIISVGSVILFGLVGEKIYIKGVLGKPQLKIKNKKEEKIELKEEKKTSIFKELVKNEWRTVNRSPIYNMNLILPVFIMPIVLGISMFAGFSEVDEVGSISELINGFKDVIDFSVGNVLVFTVAILSFLTSMSMSSSTAISRDGKNASFNKIIPVAPMTIINAKVVLGIILGCIPCLLVTVILLALGLMNILDFILINIPLFFFIVLTNYIGIYIDLRRPKLDWENETVAVKQNTNTLIYMLIDMAITMLIVAFGVLLIFIRIPAFAASLILTLIFLALCVIIYRLMKRKGLELFNNIG